jgi:predicted  nucleic acid-binding Zn-ribbon protein
MTNLEAIALRLQEEKSKRIEEILQISGSAAISKNEYNINVVDELNPASSLLFKKLNKPKLDDERIVKAIDVELKELKPNIPKEIKDLVPKALYDDVVNQNEDLRKRVSDLETDVQNLNTTIVDLQSQVQSEINNRLTIEQTNDVLVNQLETLNQTIDEFSGQIATSLQKSVDESILRAALQSQNTGFKAQINALIKQIDSLNSIIEGLQSQLGAVQQQQAIQQSTTNVALASGADVVNAVAAIKVTPKKEKPEYPDMDARINNKDSATKWISGNTLDIVNNDTKDIQVSITTQFGDNQKWFSLPKTNFTVQASQSEKLELRITPGGCRYGKKDNSKFYQGTMKVVIKRTSDGSEESKEYKLQIGIMHPKSY